ncbi:SsrA-binding protein SmpB [Candidatus Acetothermia bacterium]|jgi:SsrA-binding protein|nr:SsrA-binding protein SmpB [Candidatus Acetothermia bacterium]MCI2427381.1 SsrA-binding protein SmpB [Candidatus Acetothermia bacterium]MCI2428718.1 SsrA-binding protein SmpB [Candidatus Acetothermia bacterium]
MIRVIATNKQAHHNYEIEESIEAGIELRGTEVKSLRVGQCSLREGYIIIKGEQVFMLNVHISAYKEGNIYNVDPERERRLLLHRGEIERIRNKIQQKGYTVIPLRLYFKRGYAKVEIGIAKGRKLYDKRRKLQERDEQRRVQEEIKRFERK